MFLITKQDTPAKNCEVSQPQLYHPPLAPPLTPRLSLGVTLSFAEWVKGGETAVTPRSKLRRNLLNYTKPGRNRPDIVLCPAHRNGRFGIL